MHTPILKGSSYYCLDCGEFLLDVRTSAQLKALRGSVNAKKLAAVERRALTDSKLAKRLTEEDQREVIASYKFADKFNDFLNNPQARPDLQTPEATHFLNTLGRNYVNDKTDALSPWLAREWKKGRMRVHPNLNDRIQFDGGHDYEYDEPDGKPTSWHSLSSDELNHWADWYGSNHPSRKGKDIMQMKAPEMHQTIRDWDTDMREKAGDAAQIRGDVEHSYPDGWTVQQLRTQKELEDEGNSMGNCVGSYFPQVQSGQSMIYSLRDHHNEPHATWEINPKYETPDGQLLSRDAWETLPIENSKVKMTPRRGTMVQIQGKGNTEPIEEYRKRIKDYMETMPEEDRPRFEPEEYSNMADIPMEGNTDEGWNRPQESEPYGLPEPDHKYHWDDLADDVKREYSPAPYNQTYNVGDLLNLAHSRNQVPELKKSVEGLLNRWKPEEDDQFSDYWNQNEPYYWENHPRPEREGYNSDKEHEKALEEHDEEEYYKDLQQRQDEEYKNWYNESETRQFENAWQEALANHERKQKLQEGTHNTFAKIAKRPFTHNHFSTGEPCNCTFTKHLRGWHEATSVGDPPLQCETCGDELVHGKCKRCDWGSWSTQIPGNNPTDPTRDVKPGVANP